MAHGRDHGTLTQPDLTVCHAATVLCGTAQTVHTVLHRPCNTVHAAHTVHPVLYIMQFHNHLGVCGVCQCDRALQKPGHASGDFSVETFFLISIQGVTPGGLAGCDMTHRLARKQQENAERDACQKKSPSPWIPKKQPKQLHQQDRS